MANVYDDHSLVILNLTSKRNCIQVAHVMYIHVSDTWITKNVGKARCINTPSVPLYGMPCRAYMGACG